MSTRPTSARLSPAAEAWSLMTELHQSYGKPRWFAVSAELDLSPPQAMALLRLDPDEGMPMRRLAGALHCDTSNVTGIVDRLEDRALVERRTDPHDRRVKRLVLTEEGAELRRLLLERLSEPPEPLRRLSADDQRALRDLMRRALRR